MIQSHQLPICLKGLERLGFLVTHIGTDNWKVQILDLGNFNPLKNDSFL